MNKLLEPTEEMRGAGLNKLMQMGMEPGFLEAEIDDVFNAMISKSEAIPKLLAVVEAAKGSRQMPYSSSKLIRLDETLKALEE